jgi:hypothetical protein
MASSEPSFFRITTMTMDKSREWYSGWSFHELGFAHLVHGLLRTAKARGLKFDVSARIRIRNDSLIRRWAAQPVERQRLREDVTLNGRGEQVVHREFDVSSLAMRAACGLSKNTNPSSWIDQAGMQSPCNSLFCSLSGPGS